MNAIDYMTLNCIQLCTSVTSDKKININFSKNEKYRETLKKISISNNIRTKERYDTSKIINNLKLPIILFNQENKPFVLAKVAEEQCLIQDPEKQAPEIISSETLLKLWNGRSLSILTKKSKFDIRWFVPEFLKHKSLLTEVLVFSFVLQILALISPLFFQVVMDKVLVHQAFTTLDVLVFGLVITGVFEVILRGLREYQYAHTANRIDIQLGLKLVQHLLGLPLLFFKSRQVGAIVTRVRELDTIREFLTGSMFTLSVELLFMFIFIYVMSILSSTLTVIFTLSLPIYILIAWWFTPRMQVAIEEQFTHAAVNTSFLTESISGSETIKSLAVEPKFIRRWDNQTENMVATGYSVQQLNNRSEHCVQLLQKSMSVIILWLGASEVLSLHMTIGQLIAFNMLNSHVSQPLAKMVQLWGQYIQARVAIEKLGDVLNLPTENQSNVDQHPIKGSVSFNNIVFQYQPNIPATIQDLSLEISAGESIGIVGTSGSGKSTLARLLLRLYTPQQGTIAIDGTPLNKFNVQQLRQDVGVVLQENYLFNKSVSENIAQA